MAHLKELERLPGISEGHKELLAWVDAWLEPLEAARKRGSKV
jgi:hypothetical protein